MEDDLVNAFPTIMRQVFNKAGLKTPFLDEYVDDRERLFKELCAESSLDRACIKKMFLVSLHGGDYERASGVRLPFLQEFQRELESRTKLLLQDPRFAQISVAAKKSKNYVGRAVALISQVNERKIMQAKTIFTDVFCLWQRTCLTGT